MKVKGKLSQEDPQSTSKINASDILHPSSTSKTTLINLARSNPANIAKEGKTILVQPSASSFGMESQNAQSRLKHQPQQPVSEESLQDGDAENPALRPISFEKPDSDSAMDQPTKQRQESSANSYEDDPEFIDGEETTSKEVERPAYNVESISEQRFTPVTTHQDYQQN